MLAKVRYSELDRVTGEPSPCVPRLRQPAADPAALLSPLNRHDRPSLLDEWIAEREATQRSYERQLVVGRRVDTASPPATWHHRCAAILLERCAAVSIPMQPGGAVRS